MMKTAATRGGTVLVVKITGDRQISYRGNLPEGLPRERCRSLGGGAGHIRRNRAGEAFDLLSFCESISGGEDLSFLLRE